MPPPIPSTDPMRIDILSAVPDLLQGPFSESIVGRARKAGVVEVEVHDIRKWTTDKHGKIKAQNDGYLLMPLYQQQGYDGFFIVRNSE